MADGQFRIKVVGLRELANALRQFGHRRASVLFKAAVQSGTVELGRIAKSMAPRQSGLLRQGIKARQQRTNSYFDAKSLLESDTFYGYMVEKGWRQVRTNRYVPSLKKRLKKTTRQYTYSEISTRKKVGGIDKRSRSARRSDIIGTVPAQPFFRPAFDTGKGRVIAKVGQMMAKGITREFAKLGRKH